LLFDRCEEDRETAIKLIHGHQWRGQELKAKVCALKMLIKDTFLLYCILVYIQDNPALYSNLAMTSTNLIII